ncbi:MAG: DUF1573 domain-containing protein [Bacteroidia bacterium]|nr:DUF1573 domain-containing protein [Bacteroidia bacterium]
MKSILLSLAVVFVGFVKSNAQETAPPNPNAAEIVFETDQHDFGTLKQGAECAVEFKFKNTGKEPLLISNAQPSCGCTVPQWPKEPVKPGDSGVIKVKYDSNRVGPFEKTVTVTSNAKTQQKVVRIKGKIEAKPVEEAFPSNGMSKSGIPFEGK